MITVIVTGGIGSGKSAVCALLRERGIPVYDSDRETKALYDREPGLLPRLEALLGVPLRGADGRLDRAALAACIFGDAAAREKLEGVVYPLVRAHFEAWRAAQHGARFVVLESAVILSKPVFDGLAQAVVLVSAPASRRIARVMKRDGLTEAQVRARMAAQDPDPALAQVVLDNSGSPEALAEAVERAFFNKNSYLCKLAEKTDKKMKTDLAKILSVRGQHGLFTYIAQSRTGAIAESLQDRKRYNFSANAGITTLEDISIYTTEGELKLREVFLKLQAVLGEQDAPAPKSADDDFKKLFAQAVPDYDATRFYVSHMKKVCEWYNLLKQYASLDFQD